MKQKFDYIVIGAGAAGSVVAARLSEDPGVTVLLLEAGPSDQSVLVRMPAAQAYPLMDHKRTWRFDTGPEPELDDRSIMHVRGRMTGGSSSVNGMVYVRGNPRDYDGWANAGLADWSYAHCLPYFKKLEAYDGGADEYRGGSGPVAIQTMGAELPLFQAFLEAGQQAGQVYNPDYNGFRQEGIHRHQANIANGVRASAGLAYLHPAVRRGGVKLLLSAHVTRIRFDESKRAVGVEYQRGGESLFAEATREVLLCGGAFNSPQLLLLSGIGDTQQLARHDIPIVHDLPGVGRGLQDPICVPVKSRAARAGVSPGVGMNFFSMGWTGARWLFLRSGLGATNLWETGSFFKSCDDVDYVDIQHEFVPLLGEYGTGALMVEDGFYYSTCLMRPESRGFVELKTADPIAHPRIVNNYLGAAYDQRAMIAAVKITDDIIQQPGWDALRGEAISPPLRRLPDAEILAWLRANVSTQYHPCASCRMGTDELAVVDEQARVHGVDGLRVIDASIMPMIPSGNLNCPTMMVAEKISDQIRGKALAPQLAAYADQR